MSERTCEMCSSEYRRTFTGQRTCSRACGVRLRREVTKTLAPRKARVARQANCPECSSTFTVTGTMRFCTKTCSVAWHTENQRRQRLQPSKVCTCKRCGAMWSTVPGLAGRQGQTRTVFCSTRCNTAFSRRNRAPDTDRSRARRAGVQYVPIKRAAIYERDQWKCGLCSKRVKQTDKYPHPLSPSLDHIVPLSCGGDHVPSNVQLAHLTCNVAKASGGTQQLLLDIA